MRFAHTLQESVRDVKYDTERHIFHRKLSNAAEILTGLHNSGDGEAKMYLLWDGHVWRPTVISSKQDGLEDPFYIRNRKSRPYPFTAGLVRDSAELYDLQHLNEETNNLQPTEDRLVAIDITDTVFSENYLQTVEEITGHQPPDPL